MDEPRELQGEPLPERRTALVTGATSGFGRATARRLVADGWQVIGIGRRAERLEGLAGELGERFLGIALDVRDHAAVAAAIDALPEPFRGIDLLVNNAGMGVGMAPVQQAALADFLAIIETNVSALVAVTHLLVPTLIERRGAIINLSSVLATWTYPGANVYGATKAFVRQLSLGLRSDLHGTGVRVTSIEPGICETEFALVRTRGDRAAADAYYGGMHPLTPEDVANTIAWIAALPPHMNVTSIEVMPTSQSLAGFAVHRGS
jgi:serine 3-dehydrogenase (NADP+)